MARIATRVIDLGDGKSLQPGQRIGSRLRGKDLERLERLGAVAEEAKAPSNPDPEAPPPPPPRPAPDGEGEETVVAESGEGTGEDNASLGD